MHTTIQPFARDIPLLGDYDVVVCGGGPAGCAAAIAAARHGARTLLVEKYGFLGGATVAQLVNVVLSTNGVDFQGVWHSWARRLIAAHAMAPPIRRPSPLTPGCQWLRTSADPEGVKCVWDDLVEEAGAETLLLTHLCGAVVEDGRIAGVLVHTRAGLRVLQAARVVDATGDAAVCHEAGVAWDRGVEGKLWAQKVALNRAFGGYPAPGQPNGPEPGSAGTSAYRPERRGWVQMQKIDPLDPFVLSSAMRDARRTIRKEAQTLSPGQYLAATAAEPGVRASRLVQGIARVGDDDAWELRKRPDGIARSSWELDIHEPDEAPAHPRSLKSRSDAYAEYARRLQAGDWFDIPYGCLVAAGVDNLLVAGRCISAGYLAQGSLRIQQTCMATGEAAGVAAALSLAGGVTPREIDPAVVVAQLEKDRQVEPAFDGATATA